ncbi:PepSY domain-containing protein [Peptoniphilus senegalensis]|uniref:PepSY domain-containing protein n=1 Tax=Peptoniphilus senegalensis TaxID=1465757 RepID=UPI0002F090A3|nr:PepSY domain-containing protein [Peptoniphilus senegalensis]
MNKKILITTLGLGLVLTLSACGQKNEKAEPTNPEVKVEENVNKNANKNMTDAQTKEETAVNKGAVANLDRGIAFDGFKKLHPDAKVESFQLEVENENAYYKVDGYDAKNEYEVTVNAMTGDIVKDESEAENTSAKTADIQLEMVESVDKFMELALKDAGQGFEAGEYEVEFDNGVYVVNVEVVNGNKDVTYKYEFETGKLLEKDM